MKVKKLLIPLLLLISCMFVFAGCGNEYNAVLTYTRYDDLKGYINDDFLEENKIFGAFYKIYSEENEMEYVMLKDESFPRTRTFIVKNQSEFDNIFTEKPQELNIDFENRMLVIHTDTTIYNRPIKLQTVKADENVLTVKMKMNDGKFGVGDAAMPCQIYLFVVMDKLDITTVNCELLNA